MNPRYEKISQLSDFVGLHKGNPPPEAPHPAGWSHHQLAGRFCELTGPSLTLTAALVRDAQVQGEPVAWLMNKQQSFFPPDLANSGIDLAALAVVRLEQSRDLARAAELLARSAAFGLFILDLVHAPLPIAAQSRLAGLARAHQSTILCLTQKTDTSISLGPLVSLYAKAHRQHLAENHFSIELRILKDKKSGPTWTHQEFCSGPPGLR